jgi:hypothetical protein
MKIRKSIWTLIPLALTVGCAVATDDDNGSATGASVASSTSQALTAFEFDLSKVSVPPNPALPATRLTLKAFDPANISRSMLSSQEILKFTPTRVGSREEASTAKWSLERNLSAGHLNIIGQLEPTAAPVVQDEARLQTAALTRLANFGIPKGEIGTVLQRRSMMQSQDGTNSSPGRPVLHRYKTFVFRSINGIPVIGHRAVISHAPDGSFHKALVQWPALAATGNALRTALSVKEIQTRASEALVKEGESSGRVALRWKYLPTALASGEVTLKLVVGAKMAGVAGTELTEEPHEVDVDVAAQ